MCRSCPDSIFLYSLVVTLAAPAAAHALHAVLGLLEDAADASESEVDADRLATNFTVIHDADRLNNCLH